jgi:hypothetical protein
LSTLLSLLSLLSLIESLDRIASMVPRRVDYRRRFRTVQRYNRMLE